jgi:Malic enzyme, NAD binding domain
VPAHAARRSPPGHPGATRWPAEAISFSARRWAEGRALVATGSPFPPMQVGDASTPVAQCSNVYIFPGVGLAVTAVRAGLRLPRRAARAECDAWAYHQPASRPKRSHRVLFLAGWLAGTTPCRRLSPFRQVQVGDGALECRAQTRRTTSDHRDIMCQARVHGGTPSSRRSCGRVGPGGMLRDQRSSWWANAEGISSSASGVERR